MDFSHNARTVEYLDRLQSFMDERVYPAEAIQEVQVAEQGNRVEATPILQELKTEARTRGLWNLFLPDPELGPGLKNVEYAPLAELTGRSLELAPEAVNSSAPDTGNMEVIHDFGTEEQKERWLLPLLDGEIRSCFSMTEPAVASSDPRNLETTVTRDGDHYIVNGTKWWSTGGNSSDCKIAIVMGITSKEASPKDRYSMILVPSDTPGVEVLRDVPVFGYHDRGGHAEIRYNEVRVPASNLIAGEGAGYMIAQARLGPGRVHHTMRAIGMAERGLELMVARAKEREAFGGPIARQGVVQDWIAEARWRINQARLLVLYTAWKLDTVGNREARREISQIKVVVPRMTLWVLDKAIQVHGAAGVADDTPLARMWAAARTLRIADGPDEVHQMVIARREIGR
ncbi:MAG: acyl-CoA dehydrogenase family protein [Actinomycetota bacterium]|nr:acyl-CoA dehydrogenase family protein [Actinomycetota bacterium]